MLIGIEASRANRLQKTGVEWYAHHVIQGLKRLPAADVHSWLLYSNDSLSQGLEKGPANWHERRLAWPPKYLWTQARLSWEMFRRAPQVLFVPAHILPRFSPKRSVVTVHDVGFARHPELYKPRQVTYHEWTTRDIARRGARVITVSEFCKREIHELYGIPIERIIVTPLGIDHAKFKPIAAERITSVLTKYQVTAPYILYIGRLEKKKNTKFLIEAFIRYKAARGPADTLNLVLIGLPGAGFEEIKQVIVSAACRDQIILTGYVSEADKPALLSGALAYIQPSLYEGFGLPPLEAMACGTPVLSSTAGSLLEIVGEDNALFFQPDDHEALEQGIGLYVDYQEIREQHVRRGLAWVKRYDWTKTSKETLQALTSW